MSRVNATITNIQSEGVLNLLTFKLEKEISLSMISLELDSSAKVGTSVTLNVKATAVGIAKNCDGTLSFANQISLKIDSLERGKILTRLVLRKDTFNIESIITTQSAERMDLSLGESVVALIKSSDLSIVEYLL